jgi:hypothetical protein
LIHPQAKDAPIDSNFEKDHWNIRGILLIFVSGPQVREKDHFADAVPVGQ